MLRRLFSFRTPGSSARRRPLLIGLSSGGLDARLEKLATDYALRAISRSEWQAARVAIERAKAALPVPIVRPRELTTGAMLRAAWDGMAVSVQRTILDDIFVKVVIAPRHQIRGAKSFDAGRIVPEWRQ